MDVDIERIFSEIAAARDLPPVLTVGDIRCSHTLPEEEARIRWRLGWYDALLASGWSAPPQVAQQIRRDRELLQIEGADAETDALPLGGDARADAVGRTGSGAEVLAAPVPTADGDNPAVHDLRQALASRAVIEQAKGMIMLRERCDADAAFRVLVAVSQRSRRKLHDVAADVVAAVTSADGAGR